MSILEQIAKQLSLQLWQVENAVELIDEGATIPFIARYRKEVTGSLDDTQLRELDTQLQYLRGLAKRKEEVLHLIEEQEKLTDEIKAAIDKATTLVEVEDIYRPFRPKRRTRASVARERGLEPLAEMLEGQDPNMKDPKVYALEFIDEEKEVTDADAALAGAMDIIAENISDDAETRKLLRELFINRGSVVTVGTTEDPSVYETYYDYNEPCSKIPGHRILAINRGEREEFLRVTIEVEEDFSLNLIHRQIDIKDSPAKEYLLAAAEDGYNRLIYPSISNEIRNILTEQAQEGAIELFSKNLEQLLMQPPIKGKVVMGLDPGIRTGCKVAVVDATGKVLDHSVVFLVQPIARLDEARRIIGNMVKKHGVEVIAIGNGTASRETELFVAEFISTMKEPLAYMITSEAGASVYSASQLAAEEFPDLDATIRSAVSIARRIQDPLAELVKIDPKAIGVGQYQHDMPPRELDTSLGGVVENSVNTVGVDLNTASYSLLSYVAGINATVSKNIVAYREDTGSFTSRTQLKKVPRLGAKTFEQCAGFLRIPSAKLVLDNTAVHPESYGAAKVILKECGFTLADVESNQIGNLKTKVKEIGSKDLAEKAGIGVPTLNDIVEELLRPGRDLRDNLPAPILRTDVLSLSDLKPEMILTGTVRNVIDFGAFVDIGVHQDGLVHISQLSNSYVKHPMDVVKVGDIVKVKILDIDEKRGRIGLTMKNIPQDNLS